MGIVRVIAIGVLILASGFAAGWSTERWHRDHFSGTFAQKQHCSTLAEEYRRQQQQPFASSGVSVDLLHVAYSGVRNTCIAEVQAKRFPPDYREYTVVDLLSKETLSSDVCNTPGVICSSDIETKIDKAFERALVTRGELPIELSVPSVKWDK